MEGVLWKWTNYFSGWQPRWFVLDTGILSYYKSQDDVNNGCKGSIKMSVCDVNVHPTDNTRLDLIIPGEAHFYVKAATPQERQHWLVALGSSKACVRNGKNTPEKGEEMSEDVLRAKKSELRLYCDLLMQQVHSVKSAIQGEEATPELERINEATSLLSATCDTFIATLEDCMRLANASAPYPNPPPSPQVTDSAIPPSPSRRSSHSKTPNSRSFQRSTSIDRMSISPNSPNTQNDNFDRPLGFMSGNKVQRSSNRNSLSRSRTPSDSSEISASEARDRPRDPAHDHLTNNGPVMNNGRKEVLDENDEDVYEDGREETEEEEVDELFRRKAPPGSPSSQHTPPGEEIFTMFSKMSTSFMDIKLAGDGGIPVLPFLDACSNVLLIFDKLNPTAFVPIKTDISGNIKKIKQKYSTDPESFSTLQHIVRYEVDHKQNMMSHSATVSLIWLKRAMMFIREFLAEVHKGEVDLENCAHNAYGRTLREYHGIVIRGVFTLAAKSVPDRKDFLRALAYSEQDLEKAGYDRQVLQDLDDYITAQGVLIKIIDDYYVSMDINPKTLI